MIKAKDTVEGRMALLAAAAREKDVAIAELRAALKLALKALPFSPHPDAFEAVDIDKKLIAKYDNTTKETK